MILQLELA
ncbi:uncharacterized protein ARMOST_03762 [Armillaria ostoyae]|uniref:Uncharacterized protein n=1 Tax=Armillaria ostoyae TaxID=47428 RepID=A0A284QVH6_ARMOS|nr:uncharacterized protein ARMOST_03762 [Armillaria ostoyae]